MVYELAYSLLIGVFVGMSAGYVGSLMVLKRMALVGDALSHVALPGLALGILFNFNPFIGAFTFLFASAIITWQLERMTKLSFEAIIGVIFTFALAVGILITPEPDLLEALFGDITKVVLSDVAIAVAVSAIAMVVTRMVYKKVILTMISEDLAVSTGVNVSKVNLVYLLLVSLIVAIGIKIVGTLLVGVLVIVPAAAARNVSSSMSRYSLLSSAFGVISAFSGIMASSYLKLPVGPLVVMSGFVLFMATIAARKAAIKS